MLLYVPAEFSPTSLGIYIPVGTVLGAAGDGRNARDYADWMVAKTRPLMEALTPQNRPRYLALQFALLGQSLTHTVIR